jgi:hypothetical protein
VAAWLDRITQKEGDLGWSLIHPRTRTTIGSEAVYRSTVLSADWTELEYVVGDVITSDGDYDVAVSIPGGLASVPARIIEWDLLEFYGDQTTMNVTVIIAPDGGSWGIR